MESLKVESSHTTPKIWFDIASMNFALEGECRPENVLDFFVPVINWLNDFTEFVSENKTYQNKWIEFQFKLEYFNSASAKFIFEILKSIKGLEKHGIGSIINWHYDEMDEDHLECGKEYEKLLGLKFKYIALKD